MEIDNEINEDYIDIFEKETNVINKNSEKVTMPWAEKYRPKTIDDMIINQETKELFRNMIQSKDLDDMTLFGNPGIGKTSLARLLAKSVDAETLFIACGTDGTVDTVRNRIQPFCDSASSGRIKCIILDEFDSSSGGNAAANGMQKALRSLMEAYTDTRFIITCNYPKKIIEPIFSRCPKIHIGFTSKDVAIRLKHIWDNEGIEYDKDTANKFFVQYVKPKLPDIRSIIKMMQYFCRGGKLDLSYSDSQVDTGNSVINDFADEVVSMMLRKKSYKDIRQHIHMNGLKFNGDYELLISAVCEAVIKKDLNPEIIPILSEFAYRMSQVTDPSLQMTGALLTMSKMV